MQFVTSGDRWQRVVWQAKSPDSDLNTIVCLVHAKHSSPSYSLSPSTPYRHQAQAAAAGEDASSSTDEGMESGSTREAGICKLRLSPFVKLKSASRWAGMALSVHFWEHSWDILPAQCSAAAGCSGVTGSQTVSITVSHWTVSPVM